MPKKPCKTRGCPNLVDRGETYCPQHTPPAWAGHRPQANNWATIRKTIMERDHHTCRICGNRADAIDHITPRYLGGTDHPDNLQALCNTCHLAKTQTEAADARRQRRTETP